MVQNFPGPYELRFSQTALALTTPLEHTQRMNIALTGDPTPGTSFTNINAITRGGVSTPDLAAVVEAWLTLIAPRFEDLTVFGAVELWKYEAQSFDASFISAYSPTKTAGDSPSPTQLAGQEIYTFRTLEGGIMRLNFMETVAVYSTPKPFPTGAPTQDAIFNFIIGTLNWALGRDTSYPFAGLRFLAGQNEKSFRQRYR